MTRKIKSWFKNSFFFSVVKVGVYHVFCHVGSLSWMFISFKPLNEKTKKTKLVSDIISLPSSVVAVSWLLYNTKQHCLVCSVATQLFLRTFDYWLRRKKWHANPLTNEA